MQIYCRISQIEVLNFFHSSFYSLLLVLNLSHFVFSSSSWNCFSFRLYSVLLNLSQFVAGTSSWNWFRSSFYSDLINLIQFKLSSSSWICFNSSFSSSGLKRFFGSVLVQVTEHIYAFRLINISHSQFYLWMTQKTSATC